MHVMSDVAECRRRRGAPSGEAARAGRALALAAAIRKPVVTTDPLVVQKCCCEMEVILRCSTGGLEWSVTVIGVLVALLVPVGIARLQRINDSALAKGSGGRL
jgi:hypothetical protein